MRPIDSRKPSYLATRFLHGVLTTPPPHGRLLFTQGSGTALIIKAYLRCRCSFLFTNTTVTVQYSTVVSNVVIKIYELS